MADINKTKMIPMTATINGVKCGISCAQINSRGRGFRCHIYKSLLKEMQDGREEEVYMLRCDGCLRDFGNGEQPTTPKLRKWTPNDPIFDTSPCPQCGFDGHIEYGLQSFNYKEATTLLHYWCRNQDCGTTLFTEECRLK